MGGIGLPDVEIISVIRTEQDVASCITHGNLPSFAAPSTWTRPNAFSAAVQINP